MKNLGIGRIDSSLRQSIASMPEGESERHVEPCHDRASPTRGNDETTHPCLPWSGKCVGIADGDTIRVMHLGKASTRGPADSRILVKGPQSAESVQDDEEIESVLRILNALSFMARGRGGTKPQKESVLFVRNTGGYRPLVQRVCEPLAG